VLLKVLTALGIINSKHFWLDVEHIQEAIQNALVVVEMVGFSVIQQYAYHVAPYSGADKAKFEKKNE
jgi:Organic solute transporter Ostalpha